MILRARTILPISRPPLDNGAVRITGSRIAAAAPWKEIRGPSGEEIFDLGEVLLMPGLVNAHCHLDYTDMRGQIPRPKSFPDWIKALLALKAQWTYSDYAQSWLHGAKMLVRRGVTTVADIEAVPELLPEVWTATPLRVVSFLEMTGVRARRSAPEILKETVERIDLLSHEISSAALSPHAPYSTTADLLRATAAKSRQRRWRVTMHVSESQAEFEMFTHRRGPLYDWLRRQRDTSDCGLGSPVQHLQRNGLLGENLLAVHVNYLAEGDAELLARRKVSVAHCPRSHQYFQHDPFPFAKLSNVGVNSCLGTDSLVSVASTRRQKPELDLFAEMRAFSAAHDDVPPETIVKLATLNGGRALGMAGKIGQLIPGTFADFIALPIAAKEKDLFESIVNYSGEVAGSMINGKWALRPNLG
ncbi:MAG: amidohydrolase family protein [Verrucomicrobia bacterium]|nr:amidohydrolase family protein [Verrucomicrobiota bacterium]